MMKGYLTQIVLSLSLAAIVYSAPSMSKSLSSARNKRSFFADQAQKQNLQSGKIHWPKNAHLDKVKRNGLDFLDFDDILNDDFLMGLDEPMGDSSPDQMPEKPILPAKDEMSNVIPGAEGPFDEIPVRKEQHIADDLMDEFMMFLTMKNMGMLDMCLNYRRR